MIVVVKTAVWSWKETSQTWCRLLKAVKKQQFLFPAGSDPEDLETKVHLLLLNSFFWGGRVVYWEQ